MNPYRDRSTLPSTTVHRVATVVFAMPKETTTALALGAFLAGIIVVGLLLLNAMGCSPTARAAEAEATYLADQLHCVDRATTRAEADSCRADVRRKWGIAETATDSGFVTGCGWAGVSPCDGGADR